MYYDNFLRVNKEKIAIVIDIKVLDKFIDPHALSSFPIFNFEMSKQFVESTVSEWSQKHFEGDKLRLCVKVFQEVVMPCLEALNAKDDIIL